MSESSANISGAPTTIAQSFLPYVKHLDTEQAYRDDLLKTNKIVTNLAKKM